MDEEGRLPIEIARRQRLAALGPAGRAALLRTLRATDVERAERIGALYTDRAFRSLAELLMDLEEDPASRGIVVAELRLMEREDEG